MAFLKLAFKIEFFQPFEHHFFSVQHFIDAGCNMQASTKYSKSVANGWSPRHTFMSWQNVDLKLVRPNGMHINSYNMDDLALKVTFLISTSSTGIWPGQMM